MSRGKWDWLGSHAKFFSRPQILGYLWSMIHNLTLGDLVWGSDIIKPQCWFSSPFRVAETPSLLENHRYWATREGEMGVGRSENMSHWKGQGWLEEVSLSSPTTTTTKLLTNSVLFSQACFFLNTKIQLPFVGTMKTALSRPSPHVFPLAHVYPENSDLRPV